MSLTLPSIKQFIYAKPGRGSVLERWVIAIGLTCCLLGVLGLLRWGPSDPVRQVRVDANFEGLQASMLWPHLKPLFGQDLLAVDMPALVAELEAQAWIKSAAVRRVWPDTLVVDLTEANAFARWQGEKGKQGFITLDGFALEADELTEPDLLYVGNAEAAIDFMQWQQLLKEHLAAQSETVSWELKQLKRSDYGQWRAYLSLSNSSGQGDEQLLELRMGSTWDEMRWQRFMQAWQAGLAQRAADIAYIDLRYHGGMAVGWRNVQQARDLTRQHQHRIFNFFDTSLWGQASLGA